MVYITYIIGNMTGRERNSVFEKGESYFSKSKLDLALECYLKCIKGIEQGWYMLLVVIFY